MTIPNYITLLRVLLVPFFYISLVYYEPAKDYWRWAAFFIFLFASFTDALDGFIVRKWKLGSELGTFLDPLADKLLLICAFVGVHYSNLTLQPPAWVIIVVIFRDIFIVSGLVIIFITTRAVKIQPNRLGKTTTFFQMLTILVILLQLQIAPIFWLITAGLTIASGTVYICREMKRINQAPSANPS